MNTNIIDRSGLDIPGRSLAKTLCKNFDLSEARDTLAMLKEFIRAENNCSVEAAIEIVSEVCGQLWENKLDRREY